MLRKRSLKAERRRQQLEAQTLVGLIDAGMLMACADGEITTEELDVVASVIDGFCGGDVTNRQIRELIDLSYEALERDGYDARLEALGENIQDGEIREMALAVAATVMLCDDEAVGESDDEDDTLMDIADELDITRRRAKEIFNDVADQLGV
jgi:ABC-type branched-subunit amino acid transport system ATPase component